MRDQAPGFYTPLALVSQDGHNDFCAPGTDPYPSNHSELFLRCMALASFRPLTVLEFEFPHKLTYVDSIHFVFSHCLNFGLTINKF